jgi:hypothetical protein
VLVPGAEILLDLDGRADGEEPANEGGGNIVSRSRPVRPTSRSSFSLA